MKFRACMTLLRGILATVNGCSDTIATTVMPTRRNASSLLCEANVCVQATTRGRERGTFCNSWCRGDPHGRGSAAAASGSARHLGRPVWTRWPLVTAAALPGALSIHSPQSPRRLFVTRNKPGCIRRVRAGYHSGAGQCRAHPRKGKWHEVGPPAGQALRRGANTGVEGERRRHPQDRPEDRHWHQCGAAGPWPEGNHFTDLMGPDDA
jgi:hypothetical protein